MTREERDHVRKAAKAFYDGLLPAEKWELGDQLVYGTLEDKDWIPDSLPAPQGFWAEVDRLRIQWEET
jgi:hypothetical protein